jgi:molecular chaperone DnaJ
MSEITYYEILGVEKTADGEIIKKAYRKLAMQFHPDKNPGDKAAEEKFKQAAEAYGILSDPDKRSKYDRFGKAAFSGGGGFGGGQGFADVNDIFSHFGDIFSDFFGSSGGQQRQRTSRTSPRRGSDLRYVTEITLKDVVQGVERDIEFDTDDNCEVCNGVGAEKGTAPVTCTTCGGQGQVVRQQGFFTMASPCPNCAGEGTIIKNPCKKCRGKGRVEQHRKINLNIPAGVDNGTRLRVTGEGEGGYRGGPSGDLYVEVVVKEDPRFRRQGDHLLSEVPVDYLQVLLGGSVEVPTVTGTTSVEIPAGTQVGDNLKVTGQGVPSLRGNRRGDLFLTVSVEFPHKVSGKEKELLRQLADVRGIELEATEKTAKVEMESRSNKDPKNESKSDSKSDSKANTKAGDKSSTFWNKKK